MAIRHKEEASLAEESMATTPPPLFRVLLLNDDYTPMDFVVNVLERIFHLDRERATVVMLKVHNEGVGLAGVFTRDIAEAKVQQVLRLARNHQHPLQCVMEKDQ